MPVTPIDRWVQLARRKNYDVYGPHMIVYGVGGLNPALKSDVSVCT